MKEKKLRGGLSSWGKRALREKKKKIVPYLLRLLVKVEELEML